MSSYVDREWFYYLRGRELLLYKLLGGSSNERITQDGILRTRGKELMYPNEDIASGLRVEYTALNEPFVAEALETTTAVSSSTTINFQVAASVFHTGDDVVFTSSSKTISGITNADKYFYVGQSLAITNSINNNGTKTVATVSSTSLTIAETVTDEGDGAVKTVDDLSPSPSAGWQALQTHTGTTQTSTSGSGTGMAVTILTSGGGNPSFTITSGGSGYAVDDTIVFTDPGSTISTATLTVATLRGDVSIANNGNAILGGVAGTNTFTDFLAADKIRVQGSASNDADYTISSISSNGDALVVSSAPSAVELAGERITITQISVEDTSPDATSHINLNKMLSLAVVDYLKAMNFESAGDIERKEYYMKEFFGKLGDNESNKRNISVSFPSGPFAIR